VAVGAAVFAAVAGPLFFDGSVAWAAAMEHLFMGTNAGARLGGSLGGSDG
jgi:hypothetical protein